MPDGDAALEVRIGLDCRELAHDRQGELGGIGVVEQDAQVACLVGLQAHIAAQEFLHLLSSRRRINIGQRVLFAPNRALHEAVAVDGAALRHQHGRAIALDQGDLGIVGMGELFGELAEEDPAIAKHHVFAAEDVGDQPRDAARFDGQGLHALGMPWGNDQTGLLA